MQTYGKLITSDKTWVSGQTSNWIAINIDATTIKFFSQTQNAQFKKSLFKRANLRKKLFVLEI
jgi:hypothetical protein